ncbi:MAG: hypothetical protein JXC85_00965 [Candidatus Aenigmarchaeota archaeon]|nr:hypothetical protein [Candidatus Aenigmarchaeota archaeon]
MLGQGGCVEAPVEIPYKKKIICKWPDFSQRPDQKATVEVSDDVSDTIEVTWEKGERMLLGDYGIVVRCDEFERLRTMKPTNEFELSCENSIGTRFGGNDKVSIYILD